MSLRFPSRTLGDRLRRKLFAASAMAEPALVRSVGLAAATSGSWYNPANPGTD